MLTYHTTSRAFLCCLGAVYALAFANLLLQWPLLVGSRGLMPVDAHLTVVASALTGSPDYTMPSWRLLSASPSLVWLHRAAGLSADSALDALSCVGCLLGCLAALGLAHSGLLFGALWALHVSLANAGSAPFLGAAWAPFLSEVGWASIWLAAAAGRQQAATPLGSDAPARGDASALARLLVLWLLVKAQAAWAVAALTGPCHASRGGWSGCVQQLAAQAPGGATLAGWALARLPDPAAAALAGAVLALALPLALLVLAPVRAVRVGAAGWQAGMLALQVVLFGGWGGSPASAWLAGAAALLAVDDTSLALAWARLGLAAGGGQEEGAEEGADFNDAASMDSVEGLLTPRARGGGRRRTSFAPGALADGGGADHAEALAGQLVAAYAGTPLEALQLAADKAPLLALGASAVLLLGAAATVGQAGAAAAATVVVLAAAGLWLAGSLSTFRSWAAGAAAPAAPAPPAVAAAQQKEAATPASKPRPDDAAAASTKKPAAARAGRGGKAGKAAAGSGAAEAGQEEEAAGEGSGTAAEAAPSGGSRAKGAAKKAGGAAASKAAAGPASPRAGPASRRGRAGAGASKKASAADGLAEAAATKLPDEDEGGEEAGKRQPAHKAAAGSSKRTAAGTGAAAAKAAKGAAPTPAQPAWPVLGPGGLAALAASATLAISLACALAALQPALLPAVHTLPVLRQASAAHITAQPAAAQASLPAACGEAPGAGGGPQPVLRREVELLAQLAPGGGWRPVPLRQALAGRQAARSQAPPAALPGPFLPMLTGGLAGAGCSGDVWNNMWLIHLADQALQGSRLRAAALAGGAPPAPPAAVKLVVGEYEAGPAGGGWWVRRGERQLLALTQEQRETVAEALAPLGWGAANQEARPSYAAPLGLDALRAHPGLTCWLLLGGLLVAWAAQRALQRP